MAVFDTDLSEERIRRAVEGGYWRNERIEDYLDRWATTRPAKTALVDGAGRYTWAELARTVERAAHGLAAHGVERGGVISCQLPNWNEFVIVLLAAIRLGAVVNPIPPIFRASELRFMLNRLESSVVVIPGTFRGFDHVAMLQALRAEVPRVEHVFVARGTPGAGMLPFTTLTDTAWEARPGRRGLPGSDPNEVNEVIFTSGTTGEPKGVMHTPNTALAIIYPAIEWLRFSERDVILMSSTFGHQTGYLYGYCLLLLLGATGVWLDVWNAVGAARLIEAERVTFTMGATPFLQDLTYGPGRHD
ncbi:MAG: AMP-binding protein, partial [candidate division NC10 bacterium]